jgi:hypothetical protein
MSDNKLDFRRMKQTQFDPGQVMKGSFSELQSGLRTFSTTPILKDAYTHFIQELDSNLRPTKVEYYQAIDPARDRLTFRSDNAGDLAGKYFSLQEPITKKVHIFWYRVSSVGTAPGIGDIEHVIDINTNDFASVVAFATRTVIKTVPEFNIIGNNLVASYIDIEYYQFGEAEAVDLGTSGFLTSRLREGESIYVGGVELAYNIDGHPVYNGNTLKGMTYNPFTAEFDAAGAELNVSTQIDLRPLISKDPQIFNINMITSNTEYSQVLPIDTKRFQIGVRDCLSKFTISYVSNGPVFTVERGVVYEEQGLKLEPTNNTIYFKAPRENLVMEIIIWK